MVDYHDAGWIHRYQLIRSTTESWLEVENFARGETTPSELLEVGVELTDQALEVVSKPRPPLVEHLMEEAVDGVDDVGVPQAGGRANYSVSLPVKYSTLGVASRASRTPQV